MTTVDARVGIGAAAFGGFLVAAGLVARERTTRLDLTATQCLQRVWPDQLDGVMAAASWPGFPPQSRILPPLITAGWWICGNRRAAVFQGVAWGGALVSTIVKLRIRRPRPLPAQVRVVSAHLDGTSFPSGHVLAYTAFYGFLIRLLEVHARPGPSRRLLQGALVAMLGFVGLSRVQRGHHWASDVLASYLLGLAYVSWTAYAYDRIRRRGRPAVDRGDPGQA